MTRPASPRSSRSAKRPLGVAAGCWFALVTLLMPAGCVDPYEPGIVSSVNVLVVDGTINNLDEPQLVRISRTVTLSGSSATQPVPGAQAEVVADAREVYPLAETQPGVYQLPAHFRGEPGRSYQLRFRLGDGSQYESTPQVMPVPVPITSVYAQFNANSLPALLSTDYSRGHDLFLAAQDPPGERNFYRWEWVQYERQDWCRSCAGGLYTINNVIFELNNGSETFRSGGEPFEDCYVPPAGTQAQRSLARATYDYFCRTTCWEIRYSSGLNLFDDALTDGGLIQGREVAQIPFYQPRGCLVVVRQLALTAEAYRFYRLVEDQTKKTGGLADTPPAPLVGNVSNTGNTAELVVGFFGAAGVSTVRYWLDRRDAEGESWGLFEALYGRSPVEEPGLAQGGPPLRIIGDLNRPPTAICKPGFNRTPLKPEGWQD